MDYIKFLGATLLAIVALVIDAKLFGVNLGFFVAIGLTIGAFARRAPARYIVAYCGWVASSLAWLFLSQAFLRLAAAQQPKVYTPAAIAPIQGLLLLAGMILLHPACYGIARLIYRAPHQPSETSHRPDATRKVADIGRQPVRANLDVPRDQIDPVTGRSIWARPDPSGESALPKGTHLSQPDLSQKPARATANVPRDQIDPATGRSVWARPE